MVFVLATARPTIVRLEDLLSLRARTHAGSPAIAADGRLITYRQLEDEAGAVARRLTALGVDRGDRVGTTLPPGLDFAALLHAVPRLGATLVPMSPRLAAGERAAQIGEAAPRLVVEEPLAGAEADTAGSEGRDVDPEAPWTLLFTSGTTGRPKPVLLSARNHLASAIASAWTLGVAPDDRWLCALPVFHVGGLAILVRSAVWGTTAVLHDRFDTGRVVAALGAGEVTLASFVPTMLRRLREAGLQAAPSLRAVLLGGAPLPRDLLEWAASFGLPVVGTYGMTDTASQVAATPLGAGSLPDGALPPSGGVLPPSDGALPLPGAKVRISDGGEVLVRGPMVARGSMAGDGWLHTGDRGRIDGAGRLHVEGRLDEVIVTGGENVSAAEVEEALLAHPAVSDAGVAGVPDREWGEAVTAYVVAGAPVDATELRRHCRDRIAAFKVPKEVLVVAELPRNAAGKLRRAELVQMAHRSPAVARPADH